MARYVLGLLRGQEADAGQVLELGQETRVVVEIVVVGCLLRLHQLLARRGNCRRQQRSLLSLQPLPIFEIAQRLIGALDVHRIFIRIPEARTMELLGTLPSYLLIMPLAHGI